MRRTPIRISEQENRKTRILQETWYQPPRFAITSGELDAERWENYRKLMEETVDKDELLSRKHEWSKGVAKFTSNRNKEVW